MSSKLWFTMLFLCVMTVGIAQKGNPQLEKNNTVESMTFEETECGICEVVKMTGVFEGDLVVSKEGEGEYTGDDFVVGSAITNSIAYVSGSTIKLNGTIELNCEGRSRTKVRIRGSGNGFEFESSDFTYNGGVTPYPLMSAQVELPVLTVNCLDLLITWEVSFDKGDSWNKIGKSKNRLYVTWQTPLGNTTAEGMYFFTCSSAKGMASIENDIIQKIWRVFKSRSISIAQFDQEGTATLTYYKTDTECNGLTIYTEPPYDGQCGAFGLLFERALELHGIIIDRVAAEAKNTNESFLVKNWHFISSPSYPNDNYPYISRFTSMNIRGTNNTYNVYPFPLPEVTDLEGVPGQGNNNPYSDFDTHYMVEYNNIIYDPSYGKAYTSFEQWENEAIAGLFILEEMYDPSLNINFTIMYARKNKNNETDMEGI